MFVNIVKQRIKSSNMFLDMPIIPSLGADIKFYWTYREKRSLRELNSKRVHKITTLEKLQYFSTTCGNFPYTTHSIYEYFQLTMSSKWSIKNDEKSIKLMSTYQYLHLPWSNICLDIYTPLHSIQFNPIFSSTDTKSHCLPWTKVLYVTVVEVKI